MKRTKNAKETQDKFLNLRAGEEFIDHLGNAVRKIEDTHVALGVGYNNTVAIPDYVEDIRFGYQWGPYLLPYNPKGVSTYGILG